MVKLLNVSHTAMILHLHLKQKKKTHDTRYLIQPQNSVLDML